MKDVKEPSAPDEQTVRAVPPPEPAPADVGPGRAVVAHLDGQVEQLRDHLAAALAGDDAKAVHRARVATRRLKAGLALLGPVLDGKRRKKFGRVGRDVRRRLGPLRDLDVMLARVTDLTDAGRRRHGGAADWLAERLADDRRQVAQAVAGGPKVRRVLEDVGRWYALRQEALDAAEAVPHLLAGAAHAGLDGFAHQADMVAGLKPPPEDEPLDVHQVRIDAKALRYTLEQADAAGVPLDESVGKTFKRMQDDLGAWHDDAVLAERALREALAVELPLHRAELAAGVLDLAKHFLTRANRELEAFRRRWRAEGGALQHAIRAAFPLTGAATPPGEQR